MKKKLIIIIPVVVAVLVFLGLFIYFNYEDDNTSLNVMEKKWISENKTSKIDIEVVNNIPIYAMSGEGVIFSFLQDFEEDTEMEFNKVPYLKESAPTGNDYRVRILSNDTLLTDNDLLIFEDGYVAVSTSEVRYNNVKEIKSQVIGVLAADVGELSYYLKTGTDLTYKTYDNVNDMFVGLEDGTVTTVVLPQIMYLDSILASNKYHVNYYFNEMSNKIVLTLSDSNTKLNNIIKKYYNNWKNKEYVDSYNTAYFNYYISNNEINDKTKADLISKTYVYGYVENYPYEVKVDGEAQGIASEYIARMKRLTNIEFTYKEYDSVKDLKKAIDNKEVDIYFDYFGYNNKNYNKTTSTFIEQYVVLGKKGTSNAITSFESLKNKNVNILTTNMIYNYFKNNSKAILKGYANIKDLKKDDNLIVIDRETYDYYNSSKFSDYELLYYDYITDDYQFMIKNSNSDFYNLFNYIITTNSYHNYRTVGINNIDMNIFEKASFEVVYGIILAIIFVPLILIIVLTILFKKKKKVTEVKKQDRKKYTDMLTSLKNRNYLNLNMEKWEESKVFPQAIALIDLNNIKYVNDNYGHEAGDELIVNAASILVNTQLENSEIIRTDGNEFLIYLVGYSEKQVETYTKKLNKELKNLPYGFGAAIGYSMIIDDIKTIDDAINEASLEMRTNKDDFK